MAPDYTNPISPRVLEVFYQSPPVDDFYSSSSSDEDITVIFWNEEQWCDQEGQTGNHIAAGQVPGATQEQANANARATLGCAGPGMEIVLEDEPADFLLVTGGFDQFGAAEPRGAATLLDTLDAENANFVTNLGSGFLDTAGRTRTFRSAQFDAEGPLYVFGYLASYKGNARKGVVRFSGVTGAEDTTWYSGLGAGFTFPSFNVGILAAKKHLTGYILGGDYLEFDGNGKNGIVRFNADDTVDAAFMANWQGIGGVSFPTINWMAVQDDGKIILVGNFTTYGVNTRNRIIRLNSDGTEDVAFYTNLGSAFNGLVDEVLIQPDGKIVVCGGFTQFNGVNRGRVLRLNSDGTHDSAFSTAMGTGYNNFVEDVSILSDGSLVFAGNFTARNGLTRHKVSKVSSSGAEDATFVANLVTTSGATFGDASDTGGSFPPYMYSCQNIDDKIYLFGDFSSVGGVAYQSGVVLNADGTVDTALSAIFNTALGNGLVQAAGDEYSHLQYVVRVNILPPT